MPANSGARWQSRVFKNGVSRVIRVGEKRSSEAVRHGLCEATP
jgi:hypothetical protein